MEQMPPVRRTGRRTSQRRAPPEPSKGRKRKKSRIGVVMALIISGELCDDCPGPKTPCKCPEQKIVSMDSYGVQIMKTLADRDIMYDYWINTAIYFTLILFNGAE